MDDFHNQIDGYSSQKPNNPFSSTYAIPMTDLKRNKKETQSSQNLSKTIKQSESNQKDNQALFQPRSFQTSKQISHPLLFTPPLVMDTLTFEKEKKSRDSTLEHEKPFFHLNDLQTIEENNPSMEDESLSSDVETSLFEELEDQFIAMLEDSSSLYEESSVHFEESSSFVEESSSLFEESPSFADESSSHFEESSSFVDESSSHFEESSSFVDESSSHFEESSSFVDESSSHFEESSSVDESSSLFEKSPSFVEESSSHFEKSSSFVDESSSLFEESSSFVEESSSHFEESSSFVEESSSHFEESSSFVEESSSHFEESSSCQNKKMDFNLEVLSTKRFLPIVKIPVLLANLDFNIDLFDSFPLQMPIKNISKIDWHVHSFVCQVLLPSPNVFLKGILVADITYVNDASSSLQSVKLNIPLNKVMKIDWFYTPELPTSYQAEYMYKGDQNINVPTHRECSQQYADPIQSELQNVYIIWHDELISNGALRKLDLQGKVQLSMNLLQSQYVDLNDL